MREVPFSQSRAQSSLEIYQTILNSDNLEQNFFENSMGGESVGDQIFVLFSQEFILFQMQVSGLDLC